MDEKKTDLEKFKDNVEQYNQGKDRESDDVAKKEKPGARPDPSAPVK